MKQKLSQKSSLGQITQRYHNRLEGPEGADQRAYLEARGINKDTRQRFLLGVADGTVEHHRPGYNSVAIPYHYPNGTVQNIRFRKIDDSKPKYWQPSGQPIGLFNTFALYCPADFIIITEGEMDTMIATQCGLPAIGVPGVSAWKDRWARMFDGFGRVYVSGDNDDNGAGKQFTEKLASQIEQLDIVMMPEGQDLNDVYLQHGGAKVRSMFGVKEDDYKNYGEPFI